LIFSIYDCASIIWRHGLRLPQSPTGGECYGPFTREAVRGDIGRAKSNSRIKSGSQREIHAMSDAVIRLVILLGIFFGCLGIIEESIYLAIAVFKVPLLVIVPLGLVASFLVFVGKMSPAREGHRYE
jgi:hypothetical protein